MREKDLEASHQKHGELRKTEAISYIPPQPLPEEQAILQKMRDLAARSGEQMDLPEPEQEPVQKTCVYDLLSSAPSLANQAKDMAKIYMAQHINRLRETQGIPGENNLVEVIPSEEVVVILESRSELTPSRRHGTDVVFQHKKEIVGTHHLQEPGEVGIHPRRVNLVLRVDSGSTEPLPGWFPHAFPQATVVNLRRASPLSGK